jgi:hypothetical protein
VKSVFGFLILVLGLAFCCYNQPVDAREIGAGEKNEGEKTAIRQLIRQTLSWAAHERSISLFPALKNEAGSAYTGFDLDKHRQNMQELTLTGFFAPEFIGNYNKIYLTLDKKLRNGELEWLVGELPPFGNGANPWCNCQDVPDDEADPWNFIEVEVISLDSDRGELRWKWGNSGSDADAGGKVFAYRFDVVKDAGRWKIAYLEGFDFHTFTGSEN